MRNLDLSEPKNALYIYLRRQTESTNIQLQKAEKKAEEFFNNLSQHKIFYTGFGVG